MTEHGENAFPALPVREGENVFVWFARFNDPVAYESHIAALIQSPSWRDEISRELSQGLKRAPEILKALADDSLAFVEGDHNFSRRQDRYSFDASFSVFNSKLILTS